MFFRGLPPTVVANRCGQPVRNRCRSTFGSSGGISPPRPREWLVVHGGLVMAGWFKHLRSTHWSMSQWFIYVKTVYIKGGLLNCGYCKSMVNQFINQGLLNCFGWLMANGYKKSWLHQEIVGLIHVLGKAWFSWLVFIHYRSALVTNVLLKVNSRQKQTNNNHNPLSFLEWWWLISYYTVWDAHAPYHFPNYLKTVI